METAGERRVQPLEPSAEKPWAGAACQCSLLAREAALDVKHLMASARTIWKQRILFFLAIGAWFSAVVLHIQYFCYCVCAGGSACPVQQRLSDNALEKVILVNVFK